MPQVNVTITDEEYTVLVKEINKHMEDTGKMIGIATMLGRVVRPAIAALNDAKPDVPEPAGPIKEDKIDNKTPSKNAFDFSALDM